MQCRTCRRLNFAGDTSHRAREPPTYLISNEEVIDGVRHNLLFLFVFTTLPRSCAARNGGTESNGRIYLRLSVHSCSGRAWQHHREVCSVLWEAAGWHNELYGICGECCTSCERRANRSLCRTPSSTPEIGTQPYRLPFLDRENYMQCLSNPLRTQSASSSHSPVLTWHASNELQLVSIVTFVQTDSPKTVVLLRHLLLGLIYKVYMP